MRVKIVDAFVSYAINIIIGPPSLQDNVMYRIEENSLNVPVDLSGETTVFPTPTDFSWTRDGSLLNNPTLTYSTIVFPSISRSDAGNYAVSATNFILNSDTVQVGSDMGSFSLDVICKIMEKLMNWSSG